MPALAWCPILPVSFHVRVVLKVGPFHAPLSPLGNNPLACVQITIRATIEAGMDDGVSERSSLCTKEQHTRRSNLPQFDPVASVVSDDSLGMSILRLSLSL